MELVTYDNGNGSNKEAEFEYSSPTPSHFIPGKISARIYRLADTTLTEINNIDSGCLNDYIKFTEREPIARQSIELKAMRAAMMFGEYENTDKKIQKWIRDMLHEIDGSFSKFVGQMAAAMPYGFATAEIEFQYRPSDRKWILKGFVVLDQRRVSFKGGKGRIEYLIYRDRTRKYVPYSKVVHVVGGVGVDIDNEPFGHPEAKSALPYIKFKNSILSDMLVAGKNLATGIIVGKVNSTKPVTLYNRDGSKQQPTTSGQGKTIPSAEAMARQLENLENNSFVVTDVENDVYSVQVGDGSQFWNYSLSIVDKYIRAAFAVPEMIFSENSTILSGAASLQNQQSNIMDATILAVVKQLQDQIIEKIIRPLIKANFGEQTDYGKFGKSREEDANTKLNKLGQLISATSMGIMSSDDIEVQNKLRDEFGLPPVNMKEKMEQLQLQMAIQNYQNQQQSAQQAESQIIQSNVLDQAGLGPRSEQAQQMQAQEDEMAMQQQQQAEQEQANANASHAQAQKDKAGENTQGTPSKGSPSQAAKATPKAKPKAKSANYSSNTAIYTMSDYEGTYP